jgi:MATE family multidrug resistance protein
MKFTISSIFIGTISYMGVFVSQYTGAGQPKRAAGSMWQGLYLSLILGLLHYLLLINPEWIFELAGHEEEIREQEVVYFSVLTLGAPVEFFMISLSTFLSSIGKVRIVMWINLLGMSLNIPLDYFLIFGIGEGPDALLQPLGILGAAIATVFSWTFTLACLCYFVFNEKMENSHGTRSQRSVDKGLMWRIIKFGYPNGIQFFMEIFAFAFFAVTVGKLGNFYLSANNIVFSIEALSFFPMVGLGQSVVILVGQAIGRGKPADGERVTISGIVLSTGFVFCMLLVFLLFPGPILRSFMPSDLDPALAKEIIDLGTILLRFVVIYSLFDGLYLCCFGAVKGAGDIWYPTAAMTFWGIFGLVIPIVVLFRLNLATIYTMWIVMVFYVTALTLTGAQRFLSRKWMKKKVIEKVASEGEPI